MINQRREERVPAALPIFFDRSTGMTRDVSASGVFFETNAWFSVGEPINFSVEFDAPGGRMLLSCVGEIIRAEPRGGLTGVAVKIAEAAMELAAK